MKNETELLQECKLQLEYLNEKFGETGTTNALLTKLDSVLRQTDVIGSFCDCTDRSSFYRDKEDNDICYDCDLPIAK